MAAPDSSTVGQVVDSLTSLEASFQRLDSNGARAQVVRDAWMTLVALDDERQKLARWKDEALTVLNAWEAVWVTAGQPGPLGVTKAESTASEIRRLVDERDRLLATIDALNIELAATRTPGGVL